jgi:hypothetical protein
VTEREFLLARSNHLRRRIETSSSKARRELEQAVGPAMREHPRTGLLAGALGGVALGSAAGIVRQRAGGLLSMIAGAGIYTARTVVLRSLLEQNGNSQAESPEETP